MTTSPVIRLDHHGRDRTQVDAPDGPSVRPCAVGDIESRRKNSCVLGRMRAKRTNEATYTAAIVIVGLSCISSSPALHATSMGDAIIPKRSK
jgi:hypothetical protein